MPGTEAQREAAMDKAMRTKRDRQSLKYEVSGLSRRDALQRLADEIEGGNPSIQSMRLFYLLKWTPRVSERVVRSWMGEIRLGELRRVGELTARQIEVLVARLRKGDFLVRQTERPRWKVMRFECPVEGCDDALELADHIRRDPLTERAGFCASHNRLRVFKADWPLYERQM